MLNPDTSARIIVGCDNGASGGWAAISPSGPIIDLMPMPVDIPSKYIDVVAIMRWLRSITHGDLQRADIWIEKPTGAKSYNAAKSMWSSFHSIRGAIVSHGLTLREVSPRTWQTAMMHTTKEKGSKRQETALAAQIWPNQVWPTLRPKGKKLHDGIIDATLIAKYAQIKCHNTQNCLTQ